MVGALIILLPLLGLALWVYLRFSPKGAPRRARIAYDTVIGIITGSLCALFAWRMHGNFAETPSDRPWEPVISGLGSILITAACLLAGGAVRNFLVFRRFTP